MAGNTERYILETIVKLNALNDVENLLESLLLTARKIVNADAGSIYVVEGDSLKIKYTQNDSLPNLPFKNFTFPIDEHSIAGCCIVKGEMINIQDVYNIPSNSTYSFNSSSDNMTGYKTQSMLVFPLRTKTGKNLGVLQIINARDSNMKVTTFDRDAEFYMQTFATSAAGALEQTYILESFIESMLRMVSSRDPKETYHHVNRVSLFAVAIYDQYCKNYKVVEHGYRNFKDSLAVAAKCHDFGKVGISDVLLKKLEPAFTKEERAIMQGHTVIGAQYFDNLEQDVFRMAREVALCHHERWDGGERGYPGRGDFSSFQPGDMLVCGPRLKGVQIPLAARIVAVADVFDALCHKRCYKEAWSLEDAFIEIQNQAGKQFDPYVVESFLQIRERISFINESYKE